MRLTPRRRGAEGPDRSHVCQNFYLDGPLSNGSRQLLIVSPSISVDWPDKPRYFTRSSGGPPYLPMSPINFEHTQEGAVEDEVHLTGQIYDYTRLSPTPKQRTG
jgi:hypothetical protein